MVGNKRVLIDELEKQLLWYREEATEEEFDPDAVDAICTMLQKLSPTGEPHKKKEEVFENIMNRVRLEERKTAKFGEVRRFEENPKESSVGGERRLNGKKMYYFLLRKRGLRAAMVFIAVAGIFFSLDRVIYARENKSLFTMILEQVGWLEIEKEEGMEIEGDEEEGDFYNSWADLNSEVKRRIVVPEYVPEGFLLYGIRSWDSEDRKILQSNYYDQGNGHILIEIVLWKDGLDHYRENASEESIYILLPEYSDKNTLYYKYEDEYICMVFMENSFYRISGNIALEEVIKIREGLKDIIKEYQYRGREVTLNR